MRTCLVRTLSPFLTCALIAVSASAADRPVKVYILSGHPTKTGPVRLADQRAKVQMGARLLWEQEGLGSTPGCPT